MALRSRISAALGIALVFCVPLFSAAWFATTRTDATFTPWAPYMSELLTVRSAATAGLHGRSIYARTPTGFFQGTPFQTVLAVPATAVPAVVSEFAWVVLVTLTLLWILYRAGLRGALLGTGAAVLCTTTPVRYSVNSGHLGFALLVLVTVDLLAGEQLRRVKVPVGVLTGIAIALDPLLAIVALFWFLVRRPRAALVALGTAAACTAAGVLVGPRMSWVYATSVFPNRFTNNDATVDNQSLINAFVRAAGAGQLPIVAGAVVSMAIAVIGLAAAVAWRRRHEPALAMGLLCASYLALLPQLVGAQLVWLLALALAATRPATPSLLRWIGLGLCVWGTIGPWRLLPTTGRRETDYGAGEQLAAATTALLLAAVLIAGLTYAVARLPHHPRGRPWLTGPAVIALAVLAGCWSAGTFLGSIRGFTTWHPPMPDFEIYLRAASAMMHHGDIYVIDPTASNAWPFLYPPIAAAMFAPLAVLGSSWAKFVWTAATVLILLFLGRRLMLPGWISMLVTVVAVTLGGPVRNSVGLGQVSILLLAMILLDVLPAAGRRRLPSGVLIGIAASIKLTPAVFVPYLWFTGRRRQAIVATGTFAGLTALGWLIAPHASLRYWTMITKGGLDFRPDPRGWLHNQSLFSAVQRFGGLGMAVSVLAMVLCLAAAAGALLAGIAWARRGQELLGASVCGLATILAVPVAWHHYYVWILPLGVAVVMSGVRQRLAWAGLALATWTIAEGFWELPNDDGLRPEFAYHFWQKVAAGGSALGSVIVVVVALSCLRRPPSGRHRPRSDRQVAADTEPPRPDRHTARPPAR